MKKTAGTRRSAAWEVCKGRARLSATLAVRGKSKLHLAFGISETLDYHVSPHCAPMTQTQDLRGLKPAVNDKLTHFRLPDVKAPLCAVMTCSRPIAGGCCLAAGAADCDSGSISGFNHWRSLSKLHPLEQLQ